MTDPKAEPLTEAEEHDLRWALTQGDCVKFGAWSATFMARVLATLDATRAQLAEAKADKMTAQAHATGYKCRLEASEQQLTAATERAERAEADRDELRAMKVSLSEFDKACAAKIATISASEAERDAARRELSAVREAWTKEAAAWDETSRVLNTRRAELTREVDAAQREVARLREALEKIRDARGWDRESVQEVASAVLASGGEGGKSDG